jgi:hypothetical protein
MNIKMDLLRVAKTALDTKNEFDTQVSKEFLDKAKKEFLLIGDEERDLLNVLESHYNEMDDIKNDHEKRIKWGEKIMTIASRLSIN